jgi:tetratricopeptide (TPR) repeat protein
VNLRLVRYFAVILGMMGVMKNCQAAGDSHFRAGLANYEAGQFSLAAQAFRDSLAEKPTSGTLLNLGLAEWQQGHEGQAILSWQQAAWLNPLNRAAHDNLAYARETIQVNDLDLTWFERASTWLPANLWTWLAGGSLWLAVALVTVPGFFRMPKAGWHQTVAAFAFGFFLLSLAPCAGVVTRSNIGILAERNASLRLTPTRTSELSGSLPAGEPVRALRRRGDYLFVHTQNGDGWIARDQIMFLVPGRF